MTRALAGEEIAGRINEAVPGSAARWNATDIWVERDQLVPVCRFLYDAPDLDFSFLTAITAVDYIDRFELIYHLLSMRRNHRVVLKTLWTGRGDPSMPSVTSVWRGADLQEREVWDLMGIRFEGHPNLKRVLLWEGFEGHPLRKDFLR